MKMHTAVRQRGFALIATLMIIGVLAILVTAFTIAMRTERAASHNFVERERAQAIANGMLHRLIADQASPYDTAFSGTTDTPFFLEAYQVDPSTPSTELPTTSSSDNFLADPSKAANVAMLQQIFTMPPLASISSSNHLVRISGTSETNSTATWAYNPAYWGYARQNPDPTVHAGFFNYYPLDKDQNPIAPDWVDYYDSTGKKIGQVAYTIWDEAGKVDINMAGPDGMNSFVTGGTASLIAGKLNGLAPHDLKFEYLVGPQAPGLLEYLNGVDTQRQRNNFSLRAIVPTISGVATSSTGNNIGDDRSIFSVEELLNRKDPADPEQNLVTSDYAQDMLDVTTMSRDFEVRPEWNGDRSPSVAANYLKSYVNNPTLFTLFASSSAGGTGKGGPQMISYLDPANPLNAVKIDYALTQSGITPTDDWRQVMRLLAILRIALPPGVSYVRGGTVEDESIPASATQWDDQDVYAIALNLLQAGDPANDEELSAYNEVLYGQTSYGDPELRVGMRLSPYIVETALKATRQNTGQVQVIEYTKIWNPYPVSLDHDGSSSAGISYRYGPSFTGGNWPNQAGTATGKNSSVEGMFNNSDGPADLEGSTTPFSTLPGQGGFAPNSFVVEQHGRVVQLAVGHDMVLYTRPWMYNANYFGAHNGGPVLSYAYAFTGGPLTGVPTPTWASQNGVSNWVNMGYYYVIPASGLKTTGVVNWFSFQIDDPRMGTMPRYTTAPPRQNTAVGALQLSPPTPDVSSSTSTPENPVSAVYYSVYPAPVPTGAAATAAINYTPMAYSWQPLPKKQSLYATATQTYFGAQGIKDSSYAPNPTFGSQLTGCNYIFLTGSDQPTSWSGMSAVQKYHAAMATFALPGHPFSNLGELATVFAGRPWTTLSMAQNLPIGTGTAAVSHPGGTQSNPTVPGAKLALLLDYYTTVGTTTNPTDASTTLGVGSNMLSYTTAAATVSASQLLTSSTAARAQNHIWLFEKQKSTDPDGNLRPIRGRINLNTASQDVLMRLLCGQGASSKSSDPLSPYFLVPSIGNTNPSTNPSQINHADARVMSVDAVTMTQAEAQAIAKDIIAIRPLRKMSDLVLGGSDGMGLNSPTLPSGNPSAFQKLQTDGVNAFDPKGGVYYQGYLADAALGRLAEFGTVRAQAYTVDMVARATKTTPAGQTVTTGEVRMLAHVYLDTFSRQAFVQSVEYR